jgi:hypothetical protein
MLRGIAAKHDMPWLYKWIRNSSELIKSGDAAAVKVYEENNKSVMTAFPQLSNGDIDNIIAHTSEPEAQAPAVGQTGVAATVQDDGASNNILGALVLVMAILVVMLFLVNNVLKSCCKRYRGSSTGSAYVIWQAFIKNQFLILVTAIFLLLASAYFVYGF